MTSWTEILLSERGPSLVWVDVFARLADIAANELSAGNLHNALSGPDQILADAAWDLWREYPAAAPKTSACLKEWASGPGKAVLIMDALSLREMPFILKAAEARNITPLKVRVTGSECPSSTTEFAKSLGLSGRSQLKNNKKPAKFALFNAACVTDVLDLPFEDCPVPPEPNLVLWHTWLDNRLHENEKSPDAVIKAAASQFQSDAFWDFLGRLRQGRRLVVTSDHGYAVSRLFSSEITNKDDKTMLAATFGAKRYIKMDGPLPRKMFPPVVMAHNGHNVAIGQKKWKVSSGFPQMCHGGMSLLETAVPWLEFAPL